jgi:hypothetical protein
MKQVNGWPFNYMKGRGQLAKGNPQLNQDLYDAGCTHLNYWVTSGMNGTPMDVYRGLGGRKDERRKVYLEAVFALRKRQLLTRKPIIAVIRAVLFSNAKISDLYYLSRYRNNDYASRELMNTLRDGLKVLEEHYRCAGPWEEKSLFDISWPQHWSRVLREYKYREEKDNNEEREFTETKVAEADALTASDMKPAEPSLIYDGENIPSFPDRHNNRTAPPSGSDELSDDAILLPTQQERIRAAARNT